MNISVKTEGNKAIIFFEGNVVASIAEDVKNALNSILANDNIKNLEIDFSKVEIIDSVGIIIIIDCYNILQQKEGTIAIKNVNDNIKRVFSLMNLDAHFAIDSV